MKRWIKTHGRWLFVGLGVLFIGNGIWGIIDADTDWKVAFHIFVIVIWVLIGLFASGVLNKIFEWWEKD